jgi:DNA-binding PadR family transcriptional regulator
MPRVGAAQAAAHAGTAGWATIRSPVSWALLGLVIERADYGYGLVKRFQREYATALPIKSDWHIYRALDALRQRGLVEEVPVDDGEANDAVRQPKPHYRASAAGVRDYADWLVAHSGPARRQSQLFARQLAMLAGRPELALEVIDRCESACLSERERADASTLGGLATTRLADRLSSEEGRLQLAAILPWLHYARAEFEALVAAEQR